MPRLLGFGKTGEDGGSQSSSPQSGGTPRENKIAKMLKHLKPSHRSPSPRSSTSASQQTTHDPSVESGGNNLWTNAYNKLPDELKQQLGTDKLETLQSVLQAATQAKEAIMETRLKFRWGDKEVDVQETADRLIGWITKFKAVGDTAVQYDPIHTALPWAGVRFILLVCMIVPLTFTRSETTLLSSLSI